MAHPTSSARRQPELGRSSYRPSRRPTSGRAVSNAARAQAFPALPLLAGLLAAVPAGDGATLRAQAPFLTETIRASLPQERLTLGDAVRTALERSPRLAAAVAIEEEARFGRGSALRAFFPAANLGAGYLYSPLEAKRLIPRARLGAGGRPIEELFTNNVGSVGASAGVPIYTGGLLGGRLRRAGSQADLAGAGRGATRDDLVLDVAGTYYAALAIEDQVAATFASVQVLEEALRVSEARLRAGRAPPVEVLRIRSGLESVRERLVTAENDRRLAHELLETLMGVRIPEGTVALADTLVVSPYQADLAQGVAQALERRPEARAADARVGIANAEVGIARSAYVPKLFAAAGIQFSQDLDRLGDRDAVGDGFVTVGLSVPLFDPVLGSRLNEARAARRGVEAEREDVRLALALEVETAFLRLEEAAERVDAGVASVAAATEALRLERVRFEAGRATVTDLLDAQAQELGSRVALARAMADHETSRVAFLKASGAFPENPLELADLLGAGPGPGDAE